MNGMGTAPWRSLVRGKRVGSEAPRVWEPGSVIIRLAWGNGPGNGPGREGVKKEPVLQFQDGNKLSSSPWETWPEASAREKSTRCCKV